MNAAITLDDFKFIFFMEWAHRNLGRLLGITFVVPALWFAVRGKMSRKDQWKAFGLACGIGFQVRRCFVPAGLLGRASGADVF